MAKKAKADDGSSAVRSNGYDPEAVKSFVGRIENLESEIEILKADCKEQRGPIKPKWPDKPHEYWKLR